MSDYPSPYQPPSYQPGPNFQQPREKPGVWVWYVIYCVFMALLYVACTVGGVLLLMFTDEIIEADPSVDAMEIKAYGVILPIVGAPLSLFYSIAPFLPKNRVGWIVGIVAIGIGMTSACCMPVTIPLLIFWINERTRKFFGM
ncbi:MAG: hypothetical protein ISR77_27910 [Pirellulaceae bacterium]|nr:hypothetical protein [Pirellulaceae bacterium]